MRTTTVVVIGAGHAGLAMSRCLAERSLDHVVLERGEVANSWKHERWDSLRLLTPSWQSRLPGLRPGDADPDGFRTMPETVALLEGYARDIRAPVVDHAPVTSVRVSGDGYVVETGRGPWRCRAVVLATGACNVPSVPALAEGLPAGVRQVTPMEYRNPEELEAGGVLVVGASASGLQIADEVHRSGRPVTLAVGEHVRVPRSYRGRDIQWWMDASGVLDERLEEMDDPVRARNLPSLQLVGSPDHRTLDLGALARTGVRLTGRLVGLRGREVQFSGALANQCTLADLKMDRLLDRIDEWARDAGLEGEVPPPERFEPTPTPSDPVLGLDLERGGIRTVVWATGYRPDYGWLHVPVLDRKGRVRHDRGVVEAPGLYLLGLPFLRRRKSSLLDGAADDTRELADHLVGFLAGARAARSA